MPVVVNAADSEESLRSLFERLSQGDLQSLEPLYGELAPKIYGLALWRTGSPADAADVVQEVFVRLAARAKQLGSVRNPRTYVFKMAHHASTDLFRMRRRETPPDEALVISVSPRNTEYTVRLNELLKQLPADQREAVYLRHIVGLSFREISTATGVTLFTAASRCRLAIRKLRARLGEVK